ncbi:MAG TPA: D-alanyl-D-alanine carboxypeptidase family protein, partial [Actinomycetota bacterium]|nr:D-alanyl-D-alanine carboxypeptidase family protein [Actinomycetota bacterium]
MSTNPQLTTEGGSSVRAPRRRVLAVVVALALLLTAGGGSVAPAQAGVGGSGTAAGASNLAVAPGIGPAGSEVAAAGIGVAAAGSQPVGQGAVVAPQVVAQAAILADEATGQVLFERNARAVRAMASTTKVMTALLTLERLDERRVVVVGVGPTRVGEESLQLRRGERLTVRQLLLGLLLKSANDAGVALAEAVDGSEAAFVRRMNRKAAALGLTATHYVTPYGLDRPGHQTSARDLARLWEMAMRRADFRSLVATRSARIPGVPLSLRRFVTTNQLLGSYRWTVGGKTGFTNRAGRCLVASASRGGRRLVAVALGSPNAFADVRAMFEHGFSKYVRVRLAGRGQPVSPAADRPAAYRTESDADALVRLDQLAQVRLALTPPAGQAARTGGGSGTTSGGSGTAGPRGATTGWFVAGERRLAQVRLGPLPPTGIAPSATPAPTTSPAAGGTTGPAATLTVGAPVRVGPVPPGAPAPAIDPFLRRA